MLAQLIASRRYYQDNFPGMGCVCQTNNKKRHRTVLVQRMSQYFALESPQMEAITAWYMQLQPVKGNWVMYLSSKCIGQGMC